MTIEEIKNTQNARFFINDENNKVFVAVENGKYHKIFIKDTLIGDYIIANTQDLPDFFQANEITGTEFERIG